jgi:hypothetical protein
MKVSQTTMTSAISLCSWSGAQSHQPRCLRPAATRDDTTIRISGNWIGKAEGFDGYPYLVYLTLRIGVRIARTRSEIAYRQVGNGKPQRLDRRNDFHVGIPEKTNGRRGYASLQHQTCKAARCRAAREGQFRAGLVRSGQVRPGQVRSGQVRSGQVRSGQVRSGHSESVWLLR